MTDFAYFTGNPKASTIELSSVRIRPIFSCWTCCGVLGRGQAEVTQVVLLLFHLPRSQWADDPDQTWSLGRFLNTCPGSTRSSRPGTKSKPLWYHSYLLIPHPNPDTKLAHADNPAPHSKKASTDLKQCLKVKDSRERHKEKRKSVQKARTVTPGSRRTMSDDFCLSRQKVSPPVVSSLQLSWHWNAARLSDFKPKYLSKGSYQATSVSCM